MEHGHEDGYAVARGKGALVFATIAAESQRLINETYSAFEHHQAVMAHADWIIDLGPGAGRIVFGGRPADLVAARSTLTGEHLAAYVGA